MSDAGIEDVDRYLMAQSEPTRAVLGDLRNRILDLLPEAEQGLSYGVPAFKVAGKAVAGFSASKKHMSYLPHSGSVLAGLDDHLAGFEASKGALRFTADEPLPTALIERLLSARLREIGLDDRASRIEQRGRRPDT